MADSEQTLLLQEWDDYLAAQGVYLDECIVKLSGRAHAPDELNVAFLELDDRLAKRRIEEHIAAFIRDGSWSTLEHHECLHIIFRAHVARCVIQAILRGDTQGVAMNRLLPNLKNRKASLRWFLVDLWNLAGKTFVPAMADDWLKTRGQGAKL